MESEFFAASKLVALESLINTTPAFLTKYSPRCGKGLKLLIILKKIFLLILNLFAIV